MSDLASDFRRVLLWYGLLAVVVIAGISAVVSRYFVPSPEIQSLVDTVRVTDSVRAVVRDTVRVYRVRVDTVKAVSDSLDAAVVIVNDSTVRLPDTVAVIPPMVVADLRALRITVATQDTLLRWWERYAAADSAYDRAKDGLARLRMQRADAPRWGYGLTVGYGCGGQGCGPQATAGLTYQAKLPRLSLPWMK